MRRLKTFPALASVRLPADARIVAVLPRENREAAALLVEYDDAAEATVERHFVTARSGDALPPGYAFVHAWRGGPNGMILALYEVVDDLPADLPAGYATAYRVLREAGFTARPDRSWRAPADIPPGQLSVDQMVAIAELQECGYGSVSYAATDA